MLPNVICNVRGEGVQMLLRGFVQNRRGVTRSLQRTY